MSSTRRTAAPRKRSASVSEAALASLGDQSSYQAAAQARVDDAGFDLDDAKRELLSGFNAALRESSSGDNESGTELVSHFEAALQALTEEDARKPVSASDIATTVQETFRVGTAGMDTMDAAEQGRQLDNALRTLERRETQVVLEFNRRIQTDGQERALEWLQEQLKATPAAEKENQSISEPREAALTSSDTVKSRSRRLRGPPRS